MINFKNITQAAETLLTSQVGDSYTIERNPVRPAEPSRIIRDGKKGWIGIYRGSLKYDAHTVSATPWLVTISFTIEIQVASFASAEDAEDRLCDAEKEIIDILEADRRSGKLGGYVHNIVGYEINYDVNEDEQTYYQAAIITINAEVRA